MKLKIRVKNLCVAVVALGVLCVNLSTFSEHRHHYRGGGFGVGIGGGGIGVGIGGRHGGVAVGVGSGYWDPYYSPYWGNDWLEDEGDWVYPEASKPRIYNRTGQPIQFNISEIQGNRYTLTVRTEDNIESKFYDVVGDVDVEMGNNNNLVVVPHR